MLDPNLLAQVDQRLATKKGQPPAQPQAVPEAAPPAQPTALDVGPLGMIGAVGNGINKAIIETGDLIPDLTGNPNWMDDNVPFWKDYRAGVERNDARLTSSANPMGMVNNITSDISQFTTG